MIEYYDSNYQDSDLVNKPDVVSPHIKQINVSDKNGGKLATGFWYQFGLLASRNFLNLLRLPQTSYVKLLTTILTALFAVLLFW
jgi:hypothetical protein